MAKRGSKVLSVIDEILDIAPNPTPRKGAKRSPRWPAVQRAFLQEHDRCAVCGGKEQLNAHHIIPFEYGGPELDPENLIALCRGTFNCHLLFGHLGDYKAMNPLVRADAELWAFRMKARRVLTRMAKRQRRDG